MLTEKEINVCLDVLSRNPDDHSQLMVEEVNSPGIIMAGCWQPEKVWSESKNWTLQTSQ